MRPPAYLGMPSTVPPKSPRRAPRWVGDNDYYISSPAAQTSRDMGREMEKSMNDNFERNPDHLKPTTYSAPFASTYHAPRPQGSDSTYINTEGQYIPSWKRQPAPAAASNNIQPSKQEPARPPSKNGSTFKPSGPFVSKPDKGLLPLSTPAPSTQPTHRLTPRPQSSQPDRGKVAGVGTYHTAPTSANPIQHTPTPYAGNRAAYSDVPPISAGMPHYSSQQGPAPGHIIPAPHGPTQPGTSYSHFLGESTMTEQGALWYQACMRQLALQRQYALKYGLAPEQVGGGQMRAPQQPGTRFQPPYQHQIFISNPAALPNQIAGMPDPYAQPQQVSGALPVPTQPQQAAHGGSWGGFQAQYGLGGPNMTSNVDGQRKFASQNTVTAYVGTGPSFKKDSGSTTPKTGNANPETPSRASHPLSAAVMPFLPASNTQARAPPSNAPVIANGPTAGAQGVLEPGKRTILAEPGQVFRAIRSDWKELGNEMGPESIPIKVAQTALSTAETNDDDDEQWGFSRAVKEELERKRR